MCWVSNCRHIINSQHSQQGVGGLGPFWLQPLREHCVPWFSALLIQHPFCQHREGWGTDWFPEWTVSASKVVWLAPSTPTKFPTSPRSLWSTSPWTWWSAKATGVGLRAQAATVMGSALRGTRMWEWGCLVLQQPQGDTMAVAKTPTCLLMGATAPALSVTSFQATTPHPSRFRNLPPLQERYSSQSLASQNMVHGAQKHWRICWKCSVSGSTPSQLSQNLWVNKIPRGFVCMLKFLRRGWQGESLRAGIGFSLHILAFHLHFPWGAAAS